MAKKRQRRKSKKKTQGRKFLRFLLQLTGFLSFLLVVFFFLIFTGLFGPVPGRDELSNLKDERATLVYSADNRLIGKIFAKNRTPIERESLPQHLLDALIATEDSRFYEHNGIDGRSLLRVIVKSILMGNKSSGGGSTITQQLAKNIYGRKDFGFISMPVNKIREAILATRFEKVYSKEEILLLYLNSVPFGEDVYGIEAASNRYFNKSASQLSVDESALLVGMLKGNTYYHPRLHPDRAVSRRNLVIQLMMDQGKLSSEEASNFSNKPLKLDYANYKQEGPAQYFLFQVEQEARSILKNLARDNQAPYDIEKDGLYIETTLDLKLQEYALSAVKKHMAVMQPRMNADRGIQQLRKVKTEGLNNTEKATREIWSWQGIETRNMTEADSAWHYMSMLNASVLITEPNTGKVKVWIGGNHYRYLPYDLVLSKRMIASAFKPVIYAAGLENGIQPCDYFDNEETVYEDYDGWSPKNYDLSSGGEAAFWYALTRSLNLPTVDLYFKLGEEKIADLVNRFDLNHIDAGNPSIALGAYELSLKEAAGIYGTFANNGARTGMSIIEKIKDAQGNTIYELKAGPGKRILDPKVTAVLTRILEKAVDEGTGQRIRSQFGIQSSLAGKTGTSQDYRDAWFMSYTQGLVCCIWVGARDPSIHFSNGANGSGSALALPIAGYFLRDLEKDRVLSKKYLSEFPKFQDEGAFDCEGIRTKGAINRFFEDLFQKKEKEKEKADTITEAEETSKVGRFFKKLFKKNQ